MAARTPNLITPATVTAKGMVAAMETVTVPAMGTAAAMVMGTVMGQETATGMARETGMGPLAVSLARRSMRAWRFQGIAMWLW